MDTQELHELLRKYREGSCTPDERKLLDDWYETVSAGNDPFRNGDSERKTRDRLWASLDAHIEACDPQPVRTGTRVRRIGWYLSGVAASIIILVCAVLFLRTNNTIQPVAVTESVEKVAGRRYIVNETAETMKFSLPDGTQIALLPGSNLHFPEGFADDERAVFLEGEAFFDVTPDANRPFLVVTSDLTTKVLGTSFLVRAYRELKETVVAVKTGRVSVYANNNNGSAAPVSSEPIILVPNQQVIYDSKKQVAAKTLVEDPQVILAKPTLEYTYTNARVTEIIETLEQNYGIDILYDSVALSGCTITSDMSGARFMQQIEIICKALGAEYKVSETSLSIEGGRGCNEK